MLARHAGLVRLAVRPYFRARPDLSEDIVAVARAELLEAASAYRADMGFAFSTYAIRRMQWTVIRFLREFTHHDLATDSLSEPLGVGDDGELTLADVVDEREAEGERSEGVADENRLARICELRRVIAECRTLTASERRILEAFLESGDYGNVAARLEVTTARVSQGLASAVAKVRKMFEGMRARSMNSTRSLTASTCTGKVPVHGISSARACRRTTP